jgi:hypothetical protein
MLLSNFNEARNAVEIQSGLPSEAKGLILTREKCERIFPGTRTRLRGSGRRAERRP